MRGLIIVLIAILFIACSPEGSEGVITLKIPANQINETGTSSESIHQQQVSGEMIPDELLEGLEPGGVIKSYVLEVDLLTPDEVPTRMFYTLSNAIDCVPSVKSVCVTKTDEGDLNISFVLYAAMGDDRGLLVALRKQRRDDDTKPPFFLGVGTQLNITKKFEKNLILKPIVTVKGLLMVNGKEVSGTVSPYSAIPHNEATMEGDTVVRLTGTTEMSTQGSAYQVNVLYNQLQSDFRLVKGGQVHSKNSFNMMLKAQSGDRYGISIPSKMNHYGKELREEYLMPGITEFDDYKTNIENMIKGTTEMTRRTSLLLDYFCFNALSGCDDDPTDVSVICSLRDSITDYCDGKKYSQICSSEQCDVPESIGDLYPGTVINGHNIHLYDKTDILKGDILVSAVGFTRYGTWAKTLFSGYNKLFMFGEVDLNSVTRVGNLFISGFNFLKKIEDTSDILLEIEYGGAIPFCLRYRGPVTLQDVRIASFEAEAEAEKANGDKYKYKYGVYGNLLQTTYPFFRTTGKCFLASPGTKSDSELDYQEPEQNTLESEKDTPEINNQLNILPKEVLNAVYICNNPDENGRCAAQDIQSFSFKNEDD